MRSNTGGTIHYKKRPLVEIRQQLRQTMTVMRKLKLLCSSNATSTRFKVTVADAVLRAKLFYGLESIQFTGQSVKKLDTFQQKVLRSILGVKPTHLDRAMKNVKVLELCNQLMCPPKTSPATQSADPAAPSQDQEAQTSDPDQTVLAVL